MKIKGLLVFTIAVGLPGFAQTRLLCPDDSGTNTYRTYNTNPASEFGQPRLTPVNSSSPNYVEGRELFAPSEVAIDPSSHAIYVVDAFNNRVLGWRDRTSFNNGDKADVVLGQQDFYSTISTNPTTSAFPAGLSLPVAVVVDSSGNVYVADLGNNRILRYPSPFTNANYATPDLIIGQKNLRSGKSVNEGLAAPSAKTLAFSNVGAADLAIDSSGNLWVVDTGNNRILRFPASVLAAGTTEPAADLVVGQPGFTTSTAPSSNNPYLLNNMDHPLSLAVSAGGDLYVADALSRVLYFQGPVANGQNTANRVLGLFSPTQAVPSTAGCVNTGDTDCNIFLNAPSGLALSGGSLFVADTGDSRIVEYGAPSTWPTICTFDGVNNKSACSAGTAVSPTPIAYIGQVDAVSIGANRGSAFRATTGGTQSAGANTLAVPEGIAFDGTNMWVTDSGNNRVLMIPQQGGLYSSATKVLGQMDFSSNAIDLADNKGLFISNPYQSGSLGGGVAVDYSSNPPRLYIADTFNNRILGFKDARRVGPGTPADIIIGQPDQYHTVVNYGTSDPSAPSNSSLSLPVGVAVDPSGNLWVADYGNGRVIRFPQPFTQNGSYHANLVLGQTSFQSNPANSVPNQSTMLGPWGIAFVLDTNGAMKGVAVSDAVYNRVMVFAKPSGGDFTNTQAAAVIFGQPDATTVSSGSTAGKMNGPRGLGVDSSDRLYVADTANQRVLVFDNALTPSTHNALFTQSISTPYAIQVSQLTGNIFVSNGGGYIEEFPFFEKWELQANTATPILTIPALGPIALTLDPNDNVLLADTTNRVAFHYTQALFSNAASFVTNDVLSLTAGMIAYVCPEAPGTAYPNTDQAQSNAQWPSTLADTQVLVNGTAAPILYVLNDRVAFQVPNTQATQADIQVVQPSTGRIYASATAVPLDIADPAFFMTGSLACNAADIPGTSGQTCYPLAATNDDGSINGPNNAVKHGHYISLYGTGIGYVPNGPPDGQPASGVVNAAGALPQVFFFPGGAQGTVQYLGLVNWAPGVFQLNVQVPDSVAAPPSPPWMVQVGMSYQGKSTAKGESGYLYTIIWVD
jgi:uncharacterized protein (TIGR03437 family)